MTPHSPLGGFEEIFLLVFILMIFATFAGGNPGMVLKPLFEIIGQLMVIILQMIGTLATALLKVGLSGIASGLKGVASEMHSTSSRHIKR